MSSLRSRALRGSAWTVLGLGASQILRLGSNLLLTRLLYPEAFGLMALVTALVGALELFSDFGIGPSIVQNERGDARRFLDTAWVVQIVRGLVAWLVACALALPFANFYADPALVELVIVASFSSVVSGLLSTKFYSARRHMELNRITLLELGAQAVGLAVMASWALLQASVWALVAGTLVAGATRSLLSHLVLPGPRNQIDWDPESWRSLYLFGRWILLSTIVTLLATQSDRLIFGHLVTLEVLGVYFVGSTIASIPMTVLGRLEQSVVFPLYSGVLARGGELAPVFHRTRRLLLLGAGWVFGALVVAGPALIELLYDPRYHSAGWIVQTLAVGGALRALGATSGMALLARGSARSVAGANAAKLVAMLGLIALGYRVAGFEGAVAGFAGSEFVSYAVQATAAGRVGLSSWRGDLVTVALFAAASALGIHAVDRLSGAGGPVAAAAIGIGALSAVWLPLAGLAWLRAGGRARASDARLERGAELPPR